MHKPFFMSESKSNTKLTLSKNTISILTMASRSHQTMNTDANFGATSGKTCPPPDTDTCIGCNSLVPDGCITALCIG